MWTKHVTTKQCMNEDLGGENNNRTLQPPRTRSSPQQSLWKKPFPFYRSLSTRWNDAENDREEKRHSCIIEREGPFVLALGLESSAAELTASPTSFDRKSSAWSNTNDDGEDGDVRQDSMKPRRTEVDHPRARTMSVFDRLYMDAKVRADRRARMEAAAGCCIETRQVKRHSQSYPQRHPVSRPLHITIPRPRDVTQSDDDSSISSLRSLVSGNSQSNPPLLFLSNDNTRQGGLESMWLDERIKDSPREKTSEERRQFLFSSSPPFKEGRKDLGTSLSSSTFERLYRNDYAFSASRNKRTLPKSISRDTTLSRRLNYRPSATQRKHPVLFRNPHHSNEMHICTSKKQEDHSSHRD